MIYKICGSFYLFFLFVVFADTQPAFDLWYHMQTDEAHLRCDCTVKKIYRCDRDSLCFLFQEQLFNEGMIYQDRMFTEHKDTIFDLIFDRSDYPRVSLTNKKDDRMSEYYYTSDNKLRYFVQSENTNRFMVYSYSLDGFLRTVKHCMDPLGDHHSCVYYLFTYEDEKVVSAQTFHLYDISDPKTSDKLWRKDTIIYKENLTSSQIISSDRSGSILDRYEIDIRLSDQDSIIEKVRMAKDSTDNSVYEQWKYDRHSVLIHHEVGVISDSLRFPYRLTYFEKNRKVKVIDYDTSGREISWFIIVYE